LAIAGAVWWLYFDRFRGMPDVSVRAGFVWAQGHLLVFAGIAAAAVGVEFAIEAAAEHHPLALADRLPLGAGLAAYLFAMAAIRAATRRVDGIVALRAAAGAVLLALAALGGLSPLALVAAAATVLVAECATDLFAAPADRRPAPPLPLATARRRAER
jgi:low temperature requirement protein LtrA